MALPLIAAGIAARAVAKKLASRAAGGITGAGAKQVAPVYREMGTNSVKVINSKGMQKPSNDLSTAITNARKSGKLAKDVAKSKTPPRENLMFPPKTIKINSNPTRSR